MPLPPHVDEHAVFAALDPEKDADGLVVMVLLLLLLLLLVVVLMLGGSVVGLVEALGGVVACGVSSGMLLTRAAGLSGGGVTVRSGTF